MKRLPGILMAIGATLIVLVALTVSGLRLALPHLNSFRPQIVSVLNRAFDADIQLRQLHGSWQSFGPTLDIGGLTPLPPMSGCTCSVPRWRWTCGNPCCTGVGSSAM
ncbi:hypothetical protein SODG_006553 [Sodalis praecaptivus]